MPYLLDSNTEHLREQKIRVCSEKQGIGGANNRSGAFLVNVLCRALLQASRLPTLHQGSPVLGRDAMKAPSTSLALSKGTL